MMYILYNRKNEVVKSFNTLNRALKYKARHGIDGFVSCVGFVK